MLQNMPPRSLELIASIVAGTVTDATDNRTLAMIAAACKPLDKALFFILRSRRFVQGVHRVGFYADGIAAMKGYRQVLFNAIFDTVQTIGTKAVHRYTSGETYAYMIQVDGAPVGQVVITKVCGYWLEVTIYSVAEKKFAKQRTVRLFPTYDTQGRYIAVDDLVDGVKRIPHSQAVGDLERQIREVCLGPSRPR